MGALDKTDLAYMAGLFDAEGTLSITRLRPCGNDTARYVLYATLVNTDVATISLFFDGFGGDISRLSSSQRYGRRPCWQWGTQAAIAERFVRTLGPLLRIKRAQAALALEFRESIRSRRHGSHGQLIDEEMALRRHFWKRMKVLNGKSDNVWPDTLLESGLDIVSREKAEQLVARIA